MSVIYSLGGGHTHAHTCTHTYRLYGQKQFQETRHVPAHAWLKRMKPLECIWYGNITIQEYPDSLFVLQAGR